MYGVGGAANSSVTDVNQTENIAIYFNVLIYSESNYVFPLAIPSIPPPPPTPKKQKQNKMIKNWLIYAVHLLKFWIFKYSSMYKHFIGTQGHVYIVLTQNETSTSGSGLAQRTTNFHLWCQATVGCTFIAFVLVLAPDSFSSLDVLNLIYTEIWR